ncbi:MAG TPA: dUTP diphosphatase [Proteobacteria bacterium]|nr:dUTP diphosphatase [Pseudomonadota bacterium]
MNSPLKIQIVRQPGVQLPRYMTEHAAGMDIHAAAAEDIIIKPGERALVGTGLFVAIPPGYEAQVRPRSGLAIRNGITLLNSPGTIDADYRGEIKIIMINHGRDDFMVKSGDRLAQMIIAPVVRCVWEEKQELDDSQRGSGGFGHTGK